MPWEPGRETIEDLIRNAELQSVSPDLAVAYRLLEAARRHLVSAEEIRANDPEGAFAALYDAARKSCAALLQAQGLRPTARGGHIAVREAVLAQFGALSGGHVLRPFDRLRRRRNEMEYPSSESSIDEAEILEALERANQIVNFAEQLVDELPVF